MPSLHLTDLAVRNLKPAANLTYWDNATPGFGVRVGQRTKTWTVMRGATRERVTFGRYPDLPLADARSKAKKLLAETPESMPKTVRVTVEEAKLQFLEENYRDRAFKTKAHMTRMLNKHFTTLPKLLDQVDDTHVKTCLDKLKATPSEQLHAYRSIRCFLRWCTRPPRKFIKFSPMEGYEAPSKQRRRSRILTDDELKAVWNATDDQTTRIVRLLILWGTRNTETASIERAWLNGDVLTIPGAHTKNRRDHGIPILPMAREILDAASSGRHYFPSRWGESHLSDGAWNKIKREIQRKSDTTGWQLRDLRRTFRSTMARLRIPRDLCEVLINHAPPVLDEIYDRYDRLEEKREALEKYECFLNKLVSG